MLILQYNNCLFEKVSLINLTPNIKALLLRHILKNRKGNFFNFVPFLKNHYLKANLTLKYIYFN